MQQLARFLFNPLVAILLIAAAVSAALGERANAVLIAGIVLVSVALNFVQSYRSQRAAERLRAQVAPTATVQRGSEWKQVPREALALGDVIRLAAGDMVPADALLMESRELHVHQAALTGESMPAEKHAPAGPLTPAPSHPPTTSVSDEARVFLGTSIVSGTATARVTAVGKDTAFGEIAARLSERPPETEFERGSRQFGLLITQTVFFLVLFIVIVSAALKRDTLESLLFAVALAVGLTPEFLPMITTVTLGRGAVRMARHKVIVKHLAAMQNFGSMDVLCSDKTGTLTSGAMALERTLDARGREVESPLRWARLNSLNETGIKSPLDEAILARPALADEAWTKLDEIPFDFERRRLSVVLTRDDERVLITKGAPEGILSLCTSVELDGSTLPMDEATLAVARETVASLGSEGYRVLAVAHRRPAAQAVYRVGDEIELTLAGFLAFLDPPLVDAGAVVRTLQHDGITLKILTGDSDVVTRHVCAAVGLEVDRVVTGDELERMSDAALGQVAETADIFARVSPAQKNRVIRALMSRGHVVGYLGDGINDAPSLHAADVGISVATAVDVARDAADLILMERGLKVLHRGVVEGRRAFGNVMKYLLMGTSSNFGNMFSMAGATLFLPFLPMLPSQILLNSFLYDLAQVTIPTDNVDTAYIRRPRRWQISSIRSFMLLIGPVSSIYDFLTFWVLLRLFHAPAALFHTGWFVESLATQTLVIFVIRTTGNPLRSRPSAPLAITTCAIVAIGALLPYSPLASLLGFVPLPAAFFVFLSGATVTYLALVEMVKQLLVRRGQAW